MSPLEEEPMNLDIVGRKLRISPRLTIAVAAGVLIGSTALLAQTRPQPGTKLSFDQLKALMFHISAGRRLKPKTWPNGARVAVGLSFDVDNATADLATGNLISESISRGEYGAVDGVPRILRLLDKHKVPASFFIPAVSHLLHPQMIPSILAGGRHEIGVHGWIHEHLPSVCFVWTFMSPFNAAPVCGFCDTRPARKRWSPTAMALL